jgi:curved DNA-binding protein CbpA
MSFPEFDPYGELELDRDATPEEIKKNYRRLAKQYHPDVNHKPEAEERFKRISTAHDVLGDPEKRALYDQMQITSAAFADIDLDFGSLAEVFELLRRAGVPPEEVERMERLFGQANSPFTEHYSPAPRGGLLSSLLNSRFALTHPIRMALVATFLVGFVMMPALGFGIFLLTQLLPTWAEVLIAVVVVLWLGKEG